MEIKDSIVISNLMRAKNKQSFFALHQIQSKIKSLYPDIKIEFHILWDNVHELGMDENDKWEKLINLHIENLYSYDKSFFDNYVKEFYDIDYIDKFKIWKAIYFLIMAHYLRRVKLKHYYLIYDDDILINDDFKHICDLIINKTPILITEPLNSNCDKVLFNKFIELFGYEFFEVYTKKNPNHYGFNAGFQGIDLSIYDNFLSPDRFKIMLDLFNYQSTIRENGEEIWGNERFLIDTQQQSFFGLMNTVMSKGDIHILDPDQYYVIPNFGGMHPKFGNLDPTDSSNGWNAALQSKITHFIGHTQGRGKPKQFLDRVDKYLKEHNFL